MNVTYAATVEGNPLQSATGLWQITSPTGEPPLRFFRRVARLRFETGGMADRIEVDHGATTLKAAFGPFDYDALSPSDESLEARLAASGGTVIVTLDAPRRVNEVRLSPGKAGHFVHVHRLDGDTLADNPTVTAKANKKPAEVSPGVGGLAIEKNPSVAVATLPADAYFADRRFAIRLGESADQSLGADDLLGIGVRTHPSGPRLGLAVPGDAASTVFFWQAVGEVDADGGNVEAGEAFGRALQRYLDDLFTRPAALIDDGANPPEFVDVDLVAASDAPCLLDVTAFDVVYHLVARPRFSEGGEGVEKLVLRFPGGSITTREASVYLPGNAAVESAALETAESFRDDRLLAPGEPSPDAALVQREGVHVGIERWAAQGVTPPDALSVSGIALALTAMVDNTRVLVRLQEDWRGRPSGRELAAGTIEMEQVGQRRWATLLFPEPIVLSSEPHWILVKAADGRAVWLADVGDAHVRVFEGSDGMDIGAERGVLRGLQAMYRFLSRSKRAREGHRPASLAIGEHAVAEGEQNNTQTYDLTSAINDYLAGLPPSTATVAVPLTLTATSQGFTTLYPLVIRYDLR